MRASPRERASGAAVGCEEARRLACNLRDGYPSPLYGGRHADGRVAKSRKAVVGGPRGPQDCFTFGSQ